MELFSIETGNLKLDGGAMFGVVPKTIWQRLYPGDENNKINLAMRCLLAIDGDRKILIDTGIGNKQDSRFFSHYDLNGEHSLADSLHRLGLSFEDITDVLLTHLHFDHCGGSIGWNQERTAYVPTFPHATFHVSRQQWDLALRPNKRENASFLPENFLPMQTHGQLQIIEEEGNLFPGISIRFFHGHTLGQAIPFINYKGKTVVFTADLLALSAHLPIPYIMSYDTQPLITIEEKQDFIPRAIKEEYVLFFEHDLYTECATIQMGEKSPQVKEKFFLSDL